MLVQVIRETSCLLNEKNEVKKDIQSLKVFLERSPLSLLPTSQSAGIDAKLTRQVLLAHLRRATGLDVMLPQALTLSRERDVPEELDDPRDEVEFWRGMPLLPVGYRGGVNTKPPGNILLKQTQIKTPLSEMITQRIQFFRIGWWRWP